MFNSSKFSTDLQAGIKAIHERDFYEAHELLEDAWMQLEADDPCKKFLQGIIQLAVAAHLRSEGRDVGAKKVDLRANKSFEGSIGNPEYKSQVALFITEYQIDLMKIQQLCA